MGCLSSSESEERPGVGIGIKVLSKDNKLLVGKREKEGLYGYPGGHLEKYESWEECAARELKEETGIEV
jgi:8-oxo-dGTP diphosphatase